VTVVKGAPSFQPGQRRPNFSLALGGDDQGTLISDFVPPLRRASLSPASHFNLVRNKNIVNIA
jgi:hypothetical protein